MFISTLELFKIGIGPSSSHTMGPLVAALNFIKKIGEFAKGRELNPSETRLICSLKGSLAFTGRGHGTDRAVVLGLHGYTFANLIETDIDALSQRLWSETAVKIDGLGMVRFSAKSDIEFDTATTLPEHPNGLILSLHHAGGETLLSETYFSIGGGFVNTLDEIQQGESDDADNYSTHYPYPFRSADDLLQLALKSGQSIAEMKLANECVTTPLEAFNQQLDEVWKSMKVCLEKGLKAEGILPGGLNIERRARKLSDSLEQQGLANHMNDWLCAYAMAVNEENAAGHMVVTAPTNGAAGVIPSVLYYFMKHENGTIEQVRQFLLTAGAIGSVIKQNSSISGAEMGCQGEVGSAAAMAAAGLCAAKGGSAEQIENAAEIALEHHLGMTCDPVKGLVQVPCIERNGFGAIKAHTAASLALRGTGEHFMSLDNCIKAMKETGQEMSIKFKETSLGGLAVNFIEC